MPGDGWIWGPEKVRGGCPPNVGGLKRIRGRRGKQLTGSWENKPHGPSDFCFGSLCTDILFRAKQPEPNTCPQLLQKNKNKSPIPVKCILLGEVGEPAASPHRAGCAQRGSPRGWGRQRGAVSVLGASNIPRTQVFSRRRLGRGQRPRMLKFGATLPPRGRRRRFAAGAGRGLEVSSGPSRVYLGSGRRNNPQ